MGQSDRGTMGGGRRRRASWFGLAIATVALATSGTIALAGSLPQPADRPNVTIDPAGGWNVAGLMPGDARTFELRVVSSTPVRYGVRAAFDGSATLADRLWVTIEVVGDGTLIFAGSLAHLADPTRSWPPEGRGLGAAETLRATVRLDIGAGNEVQGTSVHPTLIVVAMSEEPSS